MKHSLVLIFILNGLISLGQENKPNHFNFGTNLNLNQSGFYIQPELSYSIKKHYISIGPKFNLIEHRKRDYAFGTSYRYFPNSLENRFQLFFCYHFNFSQIDRSFVTHITNGVSYTGNLLYEIENTIGYGFKYRVSRNFYLQTDFSSGLYQWRETYFDFETDKYNSWTINLNAGFVYSFSKN
ncbi:MAG: hypothetical protein JXR53_15125 [Bacteroidales bacterium]|nr:hypothetical protein [Bacteroidales bacterium]